MAKKPVCLDDAIEIFLANRTAKTAMSLLATGRDYWADEAISDETFQLEIVDRIIVFLKNLRG